jgi:hypothetical protein
MKVTPEVKPLTREELQNKIFEASVLATIAFNKGIRKACCEDPDFMKMLNDLHLPVGGGSQQIMEAWYASWDAAKVSHDYKLYQEQQ